MEIVHVWALGLGYTTKSHPVINWMAGNFLQLNEEKTEA